MMKTARRFALALVVFAAAPVAAQPGADYPTPPPPPPAGHQPDVIVIQPAPVVQQPQQQPQAVVLPPTLAPQNESWGDVNHINGFPVKVGERGDYLLDHKWKKTNIATNPLAWMIGLYGLSVSHAVHKNVALRGDVNLMDLRESDTSGYEIGASAVIYFKRVFQGPFIEPGVIVRKTTDDNDFCEFDCDRKASVGPSMVFGWHWTFDSGLNVAMAAGMMRNVNAEQMEYDYESEIEFSGYFRVGYAF